MLYLEAVFFFCLKETKIVWGRMQSVKLAQTLC